LGAAALTPLLTDYRIIDPHVHVWKHDPRYPFAVEANVPRRDAGPETLMELMRANGVAKTVIIQVIHYRYDNRFLLDVLKRYPGVFQGVCRVDPLDPAAPDHLSRLTEQGFRGVRLSPAGDASGDWFAGPLMPPLWKRCRPWTLPAMLCSMHCLLYLSHRWLHPVHYLPYPVHRSPSFVHCRLCP
jgi:predicted TIM-barrel fold metal-dependent hydrolase